MPYAGYGMNAGIADATNLAWLLAAHLQGWADIAILDAYEAERLPITEQVSRFAMDMAGKVLSQRRTVPEEIEQPGPEGDAVRQQVGQAAYDLNVQQYCCAGLNFGYFYDRSPIIAYDGAEQPGFTMADFTPSSTPGCRLPFAKLADGRPVYDALGPGYTLLRYDPDVAVAPLTEAMNANGVPFAVVDVAAGEAQPPGARKLVVARTDQHVAWRGDAIPDDPADLVGKLLGRSRPRFGVEQEMTRGALPASPRHCPRRRRRRRLEHRAVLHAAASPTIPGPSCSGAGCSAAA